MKTRLLILAVAIGLAACGTSPVGQQNPQQIAAQVCPVAITTLQVAGSFTPGDPKLVADIAIATPIVNTLCSEGATVSFSSLQEFNTTAFPVLLSVVNAAPVSDAQKAQIKLDLGGAQAILQSFIAAQAAAAAPAAK